MGIRRSDLAVKLRRFLGRTGDDQRCARLVDEDRVDLVDDGVVEIALHHVRQPKRHIVAQIVEAEFVVGAIGHIGGIGRAALVVGQSRHDAAHRQAQQLVDGAHPGGITARQIVIHRDDVNALAFQGVEVHRQRRDQGFSFAGLHLGDHAIVQDDAA